MINTEPGFDPLRGINESTLDAEFERARTEINSLTARLDGIRELSESMTFALDREEVVGLDDVLALYDKTNALIAEAISQGRVLDEYDFDVTFAQFDSLTKPAIAEDELVLSASEYAKDLDDTYEAAYEDAASEVGEAAFQDGIDAGILVATRVLRVMNAQVVDLRDVRR